MIRLSTRRFAAACLMPILLSVSAPPAYSAENDIPLPDFEAKIQPLLKEYCSECHDALMMEADLNLEIFTDESVVMQHRPLWKQAYDFLEAGQMPPPKKADQPDG
jgi:hypothetical protein